MKNTKLSLIVPIYNAEAFVLNSLINLTEWRQTLEYSVQIILVNDGSTDSTLQLIDNYINTNDSSIECHTYKKNKGKGFAVKQGMLLARGKYRIYTDVDIPFGFKIIDTLLYYLEFKEFDICIGNRKSTNSKYFSKTSFMRKLSSQIFTIIISRYIVTGVNDTQCGLKGFTDKVAEKLFSNLHTKGFAFDVELLYLTYKYELDLKRIPVVFEGNNISTINLTKNSIEMLRDIIYLPFRYHLFIKNKLKQ